MIGSLLLFVSFVAFWRVPFVVAHADTTTAAAYIQYCFTCFAITIGDILLLPFHLVVLFSWRAPFLIQFYRDAWARGQQVTREIDHLPGSQLPAQELHARFIELMCLVEDD